MDQDDKDLEDKNIYAVLNQFEILLKDQDWSNISSKNIACARLCLAIVVERIEDLTNNHCVCHKRKRKLLFLSSRFQYQFQILVEKISQLVSTQTNKKFMFTAYNLKCFFVCFVGSFKRTSQHELAKNIFDCGKLAKTRSNDQTSVEQIEFWASRRINFTYRIEQGSHNTDEELCRYKRYVWIKKLQQYSLQIHRLRYRGASYFICDCLCSIHA